MTGYVRNDTANNIAANKVASAADIDGEFDAIVDAFSETTGHTHDGTSAEGAPIEVTGPAQEYLSTASAFTPKTDNTYDLGSSSLGWKDLFVKGTATVGSVSLTTDLAVSHGGTGASNASDARDNLGLTIGTNVQAWDVDLDTYAGNPLTSSELNQLQNINSVTISNSQWGYLGSASAFGGSLIDDANAGAARTTLGLGSIATQAANNVNIDGGAIDGTPVGANSASTGAFTTLTASGDLAVDTNLLFVDVSGSAVGVGTVPQAPFHVDSGGVNRVALFESSDQDAEIAFQDNTTTDNTSVRIGARGDALRFITPITTATLDDGRFKVGTTNTTPGDGNTDAGVVLFKDGTGFFSRDGTSSVRANRNNSDGAVQTFSRNGSAVGSIDVTFSSTTYNTSSDRRLKKDIADLTGFSARIDALQPRSYAWNVNDEPARGFIADEFQQVYPNSVTGTPDGEEMQSMQASTSEVIADLVAEIQSLRSRVASLES